MNNFILKCKQILSIVSQKIVTHKKKIIALILLIIIGCILYHTIFKSITINPLKEAEAMEQLESIKSTGTLTAFTSDECSGNVSLLWSKAVGSLSSISPTIAENYKDAQSIPFGYACVDHDRLYHQAIGGYRGRLIADNILRQAIIEYAIYNTDEIKARIGFESDEAVIALYESIAGIIYKGVRLGGAPCTGEPYAWGYGYTPGECQQ